MILVALAVLQVLTSSDNPDELYRHREDLASARRAAEIWSVRAESDFEAAWKLARITYWLGTHVEGSDRRRELERGVTAGQAANRLEPNRPEGHFWLAANMGELASSFGVSQGLKYRGAIKSELERVLAIDRAWEGGSADAALGQWYFEVPRLMGGSHDAAKEHLRRALTYDEGNQVALLSLAEVLTSEGHVDEARSLLQKIIDLPIDPEWDPEDRGYQKKAAERLRTLRR
jgi:tetratricopeptide (TPR) repeat protein